MEENTVPIQNTVEQPEIIDNKPRKIRIVLSVVGILLILFVISLVVNSRTVKTGNIIQVTKNTITPSPTPFLFREVTIPYLRERFYKSSLGPLKIYSENQSYTSYLTSYNSDGLKINGLLTIPKGTNEKYPAIVFVHGYIPPNQYQTTERYTDYVDYLASNGFVVFKIDLRGHGNSEGEPSGAYYSSDYIVDTLNAYAALQSASFVNSHKIGLWGHSMAGNVVMRSFASKPTIPAVVIWAGTVYSYNDFTKYKINDQSYQPPSMSTERVKKRQQLINTYGEPSSISAFWKLVAPTNYLSDLKGALEINHAVDDEVVNIGYSRDLMALLDKTTVPHEFYTYPTGGHNIEGASFYQAMEHTVIFLKKYLE
ncbi:alpha/beta fold hydrolase [Candidatus Gottesmanbacteria bacterium]|nr:alpha/beta fold hydrolase [Candidatus Gottesmanbacteria bacterium]